MDTPSPSIRLFRDDARPTTTDLQPLLHRLIGLAEEGEPLRITIDYKGQRVQLIAGEAPTEQASAAPLAAKPSASHDADFRTASWFGADYTFGTTQAGIVKLLWEGWKEGVPGITQAALLTAVDSDSERLRDLFKGHPAWGTMIQTTGKGIFRLAEPEQKKPAACALPAPEAPRFSEMEDCIIEALGTNTMTGQKIADAAGYPFERSLRACLAAMRRHGILTGDKGAPGYSVAVNPAVHAHPAPTLPQERYVPFVPTGFQKGILAALKGKALRTDALGAAVGDRGRLFKPAGLQELRERGLVDHHERVGYFRPDAPPAELEPPRFKRAPEC